MGTAGKIIAGALFAGALTATVLYGTRQEPAGEVVPPGTAGHTSTQRVSFDAQADTAERLRALEQAVSDEREARRILEDELIALYTELDNLRSREPEPAERSVEPPFISPAGLARSQEDQRLAALVAAGMPAERAAQLLSRESELQYELMRAQYEARISANGQSRLVNFRNPDEVLRSELSVEEYEQYLSANGRGTSVAVATVMASSPAAQVGLRTGDQIISYDGHRVYSVLDLQRLAFNDRGTGPAVLEVRRNGAPMQVVVPRGPIGITARGN